MPQDSRSILNSLMQLQAEVRELEMSRVQADMDEQMVDAKHWGHKGDKGRFTRDEGNYIDASPTSIARGQAISVPVGGNSDEREPWGDHARGVSRESLGFGAPAECANGTNCNGGGYCFSYYDCEECEWCVGGECVERDPNRPCQSSWECPCAPSDSQHYSCNDSQCELSCFVNDDCPFDHVCNSSRGYCEPGCDALGPADKSCDPFSSNPAFDATVNSLCVDHRCVQPCEPPRFCDKDSECLEGEYCGERPYRAKTDPSNAVRECMPGCSDDKGCADWEACEEFSCVWLCSSNVDCTNGEMSKREEIYQERMNELRDAYEAERMDFDEFVDEERLAHQEKSRGSEFGCVDGKCEDIGEPCRSRGDCPSGKYCDSGRCQQGCAIDQDCRKECEPDPECAAACPPDPTCTCEGAGCDDESWKDNCERSRTCLAACPRIEGCDTQEYVTCVENSCQRTCNSQADCPDNFSCDQEGKCVRVEQDDDLCGIECVTEELCVTLEEGTTSGTGEDIDEEQQFCWTEEVCELVCRKPEEDFTTSCECAEVCSQKGECVPAICNSLEDCDSGKGCSICDVDGTTGSLGAGYCVPGCGPDTPCPNGGCCTGEGICENSCRSDSDCESPRVCMQNGCCGLACDPIQPCVSSDDCEEGSYCGDEGLCENGCEQDVDCNEVDKDTGTILSTGQCIDNTCFSPCSADSDCVNEEGIRNGTCEVVDRSANTKGGATDIVEVRECKPFPSPDCLSDEDCQSCDENDENCEQNGYCITGQDGKSSCSGTCRVDSDCAPLEECSENDEGEEECRPLVATQVCIKNQCEVKCEGKDDVGTCRGIYPDANYACLQHESGKYICESTLR